MVPTQGHANHRRAEEMEIFLWELVYKLHKSSNKIQMRKHLTLSHYPYTFISGYQVYFRKASFFLKFQSLDELLMNEAVYMWTVNLRR